MEFESKTTEFRLDAKADRTIKTLYIYGFKVYRGVTENIKL